MYKHISSCFLQVNAYNGAHELGRNVWNVPHDLDIHAANAKLGRRWQLSIRCGLEKKKQEKKEKNLESEITISSGDLYKTWRSYYEVATISSLET